MRKIPGIRRRLIVAQRISRSHVRQPFAPMAAFGLQLLPQRARIGVQELAVSLSHRFSQFGVGPRLRRQVILKTICCLRHIVIVPPVEDDMLLATHRRRTPSRIQTVRPRDLSAIREIATAHRFGRRAARWEKARNSDTKGSNHGDDLGRVRDPNSSFGVCPVIRDALSVDGFQAITPCCLNQRRAGNSVFDQNRRRLEPVATGSCAGSRAKGNSLTTPLRSSPFSQEESATTRSRSSPLGAAIVDRERRCSRPSRCHNVR